MPIDSLQKRASLAYIILPDLTIDAGDRQTLARLYSGILAAAPYPPPALDALFSIIGTTDDEVIGIRGGADDDVVRFAERHTSGYYIYLTGNAQQRRGRIGPAETERRRIKVYG